MQKVHLWIVSMALLFVPFSPSSHLFFPTNKRQFSSSFKTNPAPMRLRGFSLTSRKVRLYSSSGVQTLLADIFLNRFLIVQN